MSERFWRNKPILVNLQLHAVLLRTFSFLTKVANFKQNDSCAEYYDPNFEQQDSCARCFSQA